MRSDSWPLALTMTTGTLRSSVSLLSIRSTSLPATSGSIRSSSTRSGSRARALARPPAPVFAVSGLEARRAEVVLDEASEVLLVLDDQDARHGCSASWLAMKPSGASAMHQ